MTKNLKTAKRNKSRGRKASTVRRDIHKEVTERIVQEMKDGTLPWLRPWAGGCMGGMPRNAISKKNYQGINIVFLWGRYNSRDWLTYKQAKDLGGNVRKGEKGTMIVFYKMITITEDGEEKEIPMLRGSTVFNVEQCENLPERFNPEPIPTKPVEGELNGEFIAATIRTGADIRHNEQRAYFAHAGDYINMPKPETFDTADNYCSVLAHELVHWSGHTDRLDRQMTVGRDKYDYSFEELVAELGAAFTAGEFGFRPTVRHANYIEGWIKNLENDHKMIFRAASRASKALAFLYPDDEVEQLIAA